MNTMTAAKTHTDVLEFFKATGAMSVRGRSFTTKRIKVSDTVALHFTASHDKDRKCFRSYLTVWDFIEDTWMVTLHTGFRQVSYKPAVRFSAKALEAFWDETVDSFELANEVAKAMA